eukprot:GHUV01032141.1.p2 GENE.GHUV01032141.1~~GHUV01032141.1.p2  ORF type:complete len:100 (-),score=11.86 GHUV01032141.1:390-689(-)
MRHVVGYGWTFSSHYHALHHSAIVGTSIGLLVCVQLPHCGKQARLQANFEQTTLTVLDNDPMQQRPTAPDTAKVVGPLSLHGVTQVSDTCSEASPAVRL